MDLTKSKSLIVVMEGLGILLAAHAMGGYYLAPRLAEVFFKMPLLTIAMLSSSAISPLIALVYLALRTRFLPIFIVKREGFLYLFGGLISAWMVIFFSTLFLDMKNIPLKEEVLRTPHPYLYPTLFLLLLWGPLLEEILNRGYFFEILSQNWGRTKAVLFSSVLFVIPHGLWGYFDRSLIFIYLNSIIFTLIYMRGGLIPSTLVHAFVNSYMLYFD
ncbi:MAG: CPBP family intramembrane metalloprotease [Nitrospirae bacterium]|nr:CPBP family intramembrane metalloprotease [Nitrospirota bacterium]